MNDTGWEQSAPAWIAEMGDAGDRGRRDILDAPMLAHARACGAASALDVGCGEGRFVRMLGAAGIVATGIDPTAPLLTAARARDPGGTYLSGRAEALPFADASFPLVVSYLALIDIADHRAAIAEMARVLCGGGTLLVANLAPHCTARLRGAAEKTDGWVLGPVGERVHFAMDDYGAERAMWTAWSGIRVVNHHRPLSSYMAAFLGAGLILRAYEEPPYTGPDPVRAETYARIPWFNLMVWTKPGALAGKENA